MTKDSSNIKGVFSCNFLLQVSFIFHSGIFYLYIWFFSKHLYLKDPYQTGITFPDIYFIIVSTEFTNKKERERNNVRK